MNIWRMLMFQHLGMATAEAAIKLNMGFTDIRGI